jgi:hypothetical protein
MELKRRLDNCEVLDDEFCMECARVLGVDSDMMASAFGPEVVPPKKPNETRTPSYMDEYNEDADGDDLIHIPERTPREPGVPLATDWVKDLLPDGKEGQVMGALKAKHVGNLTDASGDAIPFENFTEAHVIACINCFTSKDSPEDSKISSLVQLANIAETTDSASNLGRIQRHENQVRLLNTMIEHDGLAAIHDIQGSFKDKRHRQMAAHVLAKIAAKIYEGWN